MRAWDFVLIREDGSGIRVHPQWNTPQIIMYEVEGHGEEVEPPQDGLGNSDGRGAYRYYKGLDIGPVLRFDPTERPHPH